MMSPHKISGRSEVVWRVNPHFEKTPKVSGIPAKFSNGMAVNGCSDWAEILCGNVSRAEEDPLKISCDLHAPFGRCVRTTGVSWARRARFVGTWHCRRGPL